MNLRFLSGGLNGSVKAPPSKSMAHRALICACLAGSGSVANLALSEDISATLSCMRALGARVSSEGNTVRIHGFEPCREAVLDCGESGSTLRFLLPVAGVLGTEARFEGRGRLPERTYRALTDQMSLHGVKFDRESGLPLSCCGRLGGGDYRLPGDISSQFLTGLLLALPLAREDSIIELTSELQSRAYVDLTLSALERFGISVEADECRYRIAGGQQYCGKELSIEGDYSNAAFWLAAGALGGDVTVTGLDALSVQGDQVFADILARMGARVERGAGKIRVRSGKLHAVDLDVSQIPDLVPILAVVMARAEGISRIGNAARLRLKESDRLHAVAENLKALGVSADEFDDALIIRGSEQFCFARVSGWNDHRMVMAMAIAGSCGSGLEIEGCQAVAKSYPRFLDDYKKLGGKYVDVRE